MKSEFSRSLTRSRSRVIYAKVSPKASTTTLFRMEKPSLIAIPPSTPTMHPARDRFDSWNTASSMKDIELEPLAKISPDNLSESDSEGVLSELLTLSSAPMSKHFMGSDAFHTIQASAFNGDLEALKKMYSNGSDLNAKDNHSKTALHCAILGKQLEVVQFLLLKKVKVDLTDAKGDKPLHTAVRVGSIDILQELLQYSRIDVNCKGDEAILPLHVVAQVDHSSRKEICEMLLAKKANCLAKDSCGRTALCVAVMKNYCDVAECILKHAKAKKIPMDSLLYDVPNGSTLLHLAVDTGDKKIVQLCLEYGARVEKIQSVDGSTPVHMACTYGSAEILKLLLQGVNYSFAYSESRDKQGMTCLHRAAVYGHSEIIEHLLCQDKGIVDDVDNCMQTPLLLAAARGCTNAVETLLKHGADFQKKNNRGRTVLHCAVGHSDTIERLLQVPEISGMAGAKDGSGSTVLHYAATGGFLGNVSLLLRGRKMEPAVRTKNNTGDIPLHLAARHGRVDVVVALLKVRDVTQIVALNECRKTPLHLAAQEKHHVIVKLLLENAATISKDVEGHTPLHLAALAGCLNSVNYLIKTWPDCLNDVDNEQNTALHLAAQNGHAQVVNFLLSIKEQDVILNVYSKNALDVALETDQAAVAMAIAEHARWQSFLRRHARDQPSQIQMMVKSMPSVAKRFMDNYIIYEGKRGEPEYKITYDFDFLQGMPRADESPRGSMRALETMVKQKRLDCLSHPLCQSFLKLKWRTAGLVEILPQSVLFFIYLFCLSWFVTAQPCGPTPIAKFSTNLSCEQGNLIYHGGWPFSLARDEFFSLRILYWISLIICNLRALLEISMARQGVLSYLRDGENVFHVVMIVCTELFLLYVIPYGNQQQKLHFTYVITACTVVFTGVIFIRHLNNYRIFSVYVTMIEKMIGTFLRVMVLLVMFLMAFASSFYMLNVDKDKKAFSTLGQTFVTTFTMTLGEFDYKEIFLDSPPAYLPVLLYVFFILFCLCMPVIFLNLLIGLAVGDIDKIQTSAQLEAQAKQVKRLIKIERSLPDFLLRRSRISRPLVENPEAKKTLKKKIVDFLVSLVSQDIVDVRKEETLKGRLEQHEDRIEDLASLVYEQTQQFSQMFFSLRRIDDRLNQGNSGLPSFPFVQPDGAVKPETVTQISGTQK